MHGQQNIKNSCFVVHVAIFAIILVSVSIKHNKIYVTFLIQSIVLYPELRRQIQWPGMNTMKQGHKNNFRYFTSFFDQLQSHAHFFTYTTRASVKLGRFQQNQTEITRTNRQKEEIGNCARAEDRKEQRTNAHVLVYVIENWIVDRND